MMLSLWQGDGRSSRWHNRWPNGADLDPDVLHGDFEPASGRPAKLIHEYRLHAAG